MKRITLYRVLLVCLVAVSIYSFLAVNTDSRNSASHSGKAIEVMTQDSEREEQVKKLFPPDLALIKKAIELLSKYF